MTYQLRPYQREAVNACLSWVKKTIDPCLVELPTGAGKSLVIAELSKQLTMLSKGKKVLVLQPSKELLEQNSARYKLTGEPCSLFSASVGIKSIRNSVIFATPLSVKGSLKRFDGQFCAVIMDESHLLTPTIIKIIDSMREHNPNLRVIGCTATPFSMNGGLLYKLDNEDKPTPPDKGKNPYFTKLVYKLRARYLIDNGWLTQPVIGSVGDKYDTEQLEVKAGRYTPESIDRAFVGLGRKTAAIVEEIVWKAQGHRTVMIFGSTVAHCKEIMASLPPDISRMVDGSTPKKEREKIIKQTKQGLIKYLTSCETMTTGVDIESVSIIAILRATLSPVLITQMIGRSLRIYPGKKEAIILDYTTSNISTFFPDFDLFNPQIKVARDKKSSGIIKAICPQCSVENEFSARQNDDGFGIDAEGYFLDLTGNRIMTEHGPATAHYGRRCFGLHLRNGTYHRCQYRWTFKLCPHCEAENDYAAKYCISCKGEIIDPGEKLILEYKAMRKDPTIKQVDAVLSWRKNKTLSSTKKECLKVDYVTEHRAFSVWLHPRGNSQFLIYEYEKFIKATQGGEVMPKTLEYQKQPNGFYRVFGYNKPMPECPV